MKKTLLAGLLLFIKILNVYPQSEGFTATRAEVDFTRTLQNWDGFGFNYVETAHSYDYNKFPQEYGGFSLLTEKQKQEIINLVFGEDGLKPGIIKITAFYLTIPGIVDPDMLSGGHCAFDTRNPAIRCILEVEISPFPFIQSLNCKALKAYLFHHFYLQQPNF